MARRIHEIKRVDRYLRDEMSAQELAEFEDAMMDSTELQDELQAAISLRETLALAPDTGRSAPPGHFTGSGAARWPLVALAVSIVAAVGSTALLLQSKSEMRGLQVELARQGQPQADILLVPVDIMRSAGPSVPDVIIRKPEGRGAMMLDVELGPAAQAEAELDFYLLDESGRVTQEWSAIPGSDGRSRVLLFGETLPSARLWLQVQAGDGRTLERRLIEFR
jgi:hypothetical protein